MRLKSKRKFIEREHIFMNEFDLKIRYPHQINQNDIDHLGMLDATAILSKFDTMRWRQQLMRQLQLDGVNPDFIAINRITGQTMHIILDTYASSEQLQFKLQTDIPVRVAKKEMFGLFTRQTQESVNFTGLSLAQVKAYLVAFLDQGITTLIEDYHHGLHEQLKSA